jgi:ribonuclease HI
MTPGAQGELKWWLRQLHGNEPWNWQILPVRATITTDASPTGWGAYFSTTAMQSYAFGRWKEHQRRMSSNANELTAVTKAMSHFKDRIRELGPATIFIQSDNTTTVHIINSRRAALSLCVCLRSLLREAQRAQVELKAAYLPGAQNDTADRLSRMGELTGFHLKSATLQKLLNDIHFTPTLDVFGREPELRQLAKAEEEPEATRRRHEHGDMLCWEGERLFLHPPLNKIGMVLERLRREPAQAVMITPAWKSQPWSPVLGEMAERQIYLGSYDEVMVTTVDFRRGAWRLPPGEVVASLLGTRMMKGSNYSTNFSLH